MAAPTAGIVGPEGHVAIEQAGRPLPVACLLDRRPIGARGVTELEDGRLDGGRDGVGHRGL